MDVLVLNMISVELFAACRGNFFDPQPTNSGRCSFIAICCSTEQFFGAVPWMCAMFVAHHLLNYFKLHCAAESATLFYSLALWPYTRPHFKTTRIAFTQYNFLQTLPFFSIHCFFFVCSLHSSSSNPTSLFHSRVSSLTLFLQSLPLHCVCCVRFFLCSSILCAFGLVAH